MKVLLVNTNDILGGAARAVYRLHRALLEEGINSIMLVQRKLSDDYTVIDLANNKIRKGFNLLRPTIDQIPVKFYKNRTKTLFSPSWFGFSNVIKKISEINPDIVHLNWITGGMIRIEDLAKIKQPIVWTLHDNWAFTGGCHIMWECEKYKTECGACPILGSLKEDDLSKKVFLRKKKTFSKIRNMVIVTPSRWLYECSKNSALLKDRRHFRIPNLVNTDVFKPFDKEKARELWNLPKNKKLILFGAMNALSDVNKGFNLLVEAIHKINYEDIEIVIFGSSQPERPPNFKFRTHYLGRLYDDISLVSLYNAADITVVPSLQENLSNTIMESLSCGVPVVAFNIGGNSDMIEHKINGYLAKPFDTEDLAQGIEWILSLSESEYNRLCRNARDKVLKEFDSKIVAKKYIKLYEEVLNKQ